MSAERLIEMNVRWLEQAESLLARLDDETYEGRRIGCHLRHILEFYECLLEGVATGVIDYDARRRDAAVEQSRAVAAARIQHLKAALFGSAAFPGSMAVQVRMEDAGAADPLLLSTFARELQVLSSHTVHHFAIVACALRDAGMPMDAEFGVAPSTLRYRQSLREAA